MMDAAND